MTSHRTLARFARRAMKALLLSVLPAALLIEIAVAQDPAGRGGRGIPAGDPSANSDKDTRPYDKHDFSGLWSRNPSTYKLPACPECRDDQNVPAGYGLSFRRSVTIQSRAASH